MTTGALERLIRRGAPARTSNVEHCDLCSVGVSERHRHLLDTAEQQVLCVCQACSLLFEQDAASEGHFRRIGERRTQLEPVATTKVGVPVGLAYFVLQPDGSALAHYPSPVGATQWEIDAETWAALVADHPALESLEPEVEALLVNTTRGRRQHWLVPISDCFRLVAVVHREWTGLTGGDRVWPAVDEFFEDLRATGRPG